MTNDPSAKDRNTVERHDHEDQHPKHSWRTQWRICFTEGWSQWQLTCKTRLDLDSWLTFLFTLKSWYQAVFAWNQRDLSAKRLKPISWLQGLKKLQRNLQRFLPILLDKHGQTALWHCSLAGWSLWIFDVVLTPPSNLLGWPLYPLSTTYDVRLRLVAFTSLCSSILCQWA